ncbi:MAG: hypothetical protein IJA89_00220 [Clostridia bacterium]|nr:hypothetical protein [Clostridia bacterium]
MKLRTKLLSLICVGTLIASCVGVCATWDYAEEDTPAIGGEIEGSLGEFKWDTAEILPSGVATQNHIHLINEIVEDLNEEGSQLNTQIDNRLNRKRDEFGSMDLWMENRMEQLFGLDTTGLSFLLHYPEDEPNTRYLYTTNIDMGSSGVLWGSGTFNIPEGEYIYQVFQTRLELITDESGNQLWTPVETKLGYAESAEYPNTYAGTWLSSTPSFDPESFVAEKRGTTRNTAIYSFVGQSSVIYTNNATDVIWYKVKHGATGTRTVLTYDTSCTIKVYDKNGKEITNVTTSNVDANGKACVSVSWRATASTQYYFTLTGNTAIDFKIS